MNIPPIAMRDAFLRRICQAMESDNSIFFVTADFGSPVLDKIKIQFPNRFVNVGIAEQNLINISSGLAIEGFKVFAYGIASFITMRCYEQIRISLALLSEVRPINVTLIGVGAGYSYVVSGPTHQCYEDLTLMRAMPNMAIYSPADHVTAVNFFEQCLGTQGPKYLRLDAQVLPVIYETIPANFNSGYHVHWTGESICLIATGYMLHTAFKVAKRLQAMAINVAVVDLFNLSHFDTDALAAVLSQYQRIITLEEGFKGRGGVDSLMFEFLARRNINVRMLNIGVKGSYRFELGSREHLHEAAGIGVEVVTKNIIEFSGLSFKENTEIYLYK